MVIYSVFLPLKLWTIWFYTGLSVFLLGLIVPTITLVNIASTPKGKPFTKGVYRYSRNALSLGMLFAFLGIGWVLTMLTLLNLIMNGVQVVGGSNPLTPIIRVNLIGQTT